MNILSNIIDYYNFFLGNGYGVVVPYKKIYGPIFLRSEITKWFRENCCLDKCKIIIIEDDEGNTLVKLLFLHKDDAILFRLWLE